MTIVRDILDEDMLEREFEHIRKVFRGLKEDEKPLRIEWGTKKAFEAMNRVGRKCEDCGKPMLLQTVRWCGANAVIWRCVCGNIAPVTYTLEEMKGAVHWTKNNGKVADVAENLVIITVHSIDLTVDQFRLLKEYLHRKRIKHYAQVLLMKRVKDR